MVKTGILKKSKVLPLTNYRIPNTETKIKSFTKSCENSEHLSFQTSIWWSQNFVCCVS